MITLFCFLDTDIVSPEFNLRKHSMESLHNRSSSFLSFVPCLFTALYIKLTFLLGAPQLELICNTSSSPSFTLVTFSAHCDG